MDSVSIARRERRRGMPQRKGTGKRAASPQTLHRQWLGDPLSLVRKRKGRPEAALPFLAARALPLLLALLLALLLHRKRARSYQEQIHVLRCVCEVPVCLMSVVQVAEDVGLL